MKRREFLIRTGQTVIAFPMVLQAVSCGSDETAMAPQDDPTSFDVTSSQDDGHTHRITFECTDLSAGAADYTSTSAGGHTHSIHVTLEDAAKILNGESVAVTSTIDFGHSHTWTIQKPSTACPSTPPPATEFDVTSSFDFSHTHRITFTCASLSAGTVDYTSTVDNAHDHRIQLAMGDTDRILNGESVMVTSTTDNGHSHTWTIEKPTNACP